MAHLGAERRANLRDHRPDVTHRMTSQNARSDYRIAVAWESRSAGSLTVTRLATPRA